MSSAQASAWIFQGNPKEWDIAKFVRDVRDGRADARVSWLVDAHSDRMAPGDRIFLWATGDDRVAGILATGHVTDGPSVLPEDQAAYRRLNSAEKYAGDQMRAVIEIDRVLPKTLFRVKLQWDPELKDCEFLNESETMVVALKSTEAAALEDRCDAVRPPRSKSRSAA